MRSPWACGSLLLTNDLTENGQAELFRDGVHLVTYRDAEELLDKIEYYLKHDGVRERIAAAGREEVLAKHTYRRRMERLLAEVGSRVQESVVRVQGSGSDSSVFGETSAGGKKDSHASTPQPLNVSALARDRSYFDHSRPELLALVPESARQILDIGCGAGRLGEAIKSRQPAEVVGIELDPKAANLAKSRLDRVVIGDVEKLDEPFPPHSFDVVICGDILEHLRDPAGLLRKTRMWLRPDGQLIASIPNVRHHSVVRGLLN